MNDQNGGACPGLYFPALWWSTRNWLEEWKLIVNTSAWLGTLQHIWPDRWLKKLVPRTSEINFVKAWIESFVSHQMDYLWCDMDLQLLWCQVIKRKIVRYVEFMSQWNLIMQYVLYQRLGRVMFHSKFYQQSQSILLSHCSILMFRSFTSSSDGFSSSSCGLLPFIIFSGGLVGDGELTGEASLFN